MAGEGCIVGLFAEEPNRVKAGLAVAGAPEGRFASERLCAAGIDRSGERAGQAGQGQATRVDIDEPVNRERRAGECRLDRSRGHGQSVPARRRLQCGGHDECGRGKNRRGLHPPTEGKTGVPPLVDGRRPSGNKPEGEWPEESGLAEGRNEQQQGGGKNRALGVVAPRISCGEGEDGESGEQGEYGGGGEFALRGPEEKNVRFRPDAKASRGELCCSDGKGDGAQGPATRQS